MGGPDGDMRVTVVPSQDLEGGNGGRESVEEGEGEGNKPKR